MSSQKLSHAGGPVVTPSRKVHIQCQPSHRTVLPDTISDVFTSGNQDGDVTLVAKDGHSVQAHQCILSFSPMLAKIFQDHGAKAFMGMAITFAGFHGKSLEALVQFLYTGEVGLVTKDDTTNEFAELCKNLQINPAVTKYRNQGSGKKARSSAKPRYGGSGGQGENADSEFKEPKPPAAESHQSKKSKHEETSGKSRSVRAGSFSPPYRGGGGDASSGGPSTTPSAPKKRRASSEDSSAGGSISSNSKNDPHRPHKKSKSQHSIGENGPSSTSGHGTENQSKSSSGSSSSGKKSRHSSTNEDRSESSSKKKVPVDKSGQDTKKALANNDKDEGESTQEKTATICEGDGGKDKSEESQRLKVAKEWAEGLRGSGTAQDPKTPVPPLSSELPPTPASPTEKRDPVDARTPEHQGIPDVEVGSPYSSPSPRAQPSQVSGSGPLDALSPFPGLQTPSFDLPLEVIKGPTAFYASSSSSSPPYSAAAVSIKSEPETATPAAMQTEPTATASPAETKPKPSIQNPPGDAPPSKTPVLRTDKEQHASQGTSSAPSTSQKSPASITPVKAPRAPAAPLAKSPLLLRKGAREAAAAAAQNKRKVAAPQAHSSSAKEEIEEKRRRIMNKIKQEGPLEGVKGKRSKSTDSKKQVERYGDQFKSDSKTGTPRKKGRRSAKRDSSSSSSSKRQHSKNRYKYEDEDDANWLVDDKDSSEDDGSQEWSPSEDESKVFADQRFVKSDAKSDGETASDGKDSDEVSISTSSSEEESFSPSKRKRMFKPPPSTQSDTGRSGSQKSLKPLTFEQRSASPRELAQWILGRNRQRAVVSVQLEGTDKVMERLTYLWKSKQKDEESSESSDGGLSSSALAAMEKERKKKFSRINKPFQSSSDEADGGSEKARERSSKSKNKKPHSHSSPQHPPSAPIGGSSKVFSASSSASTPLRLRLPGTPQSKQQTPQRSSISSSSLSGPHSAPPHQKPLLANLPQALQSFQIPKKQRTPIQVSEPPLFSPDPTPSVSSASNQPSSSSQSAK